MQPPPLVGSAAAAAALLAPVPWARPRTAQPAQRPRPTQRSLEQQPLREAKVWPTAPPLEPPQPKPRPPAEPPAKHLLLDAGGAKTQLPSSPRPPPMPPPPWRQPGSALVAGSQPSEERAVAGVEAATTMAQADPWWSGLSLVDPPEAQRWYSSVLDRLDASCASSRLESQTAWAPPRGKGSNAWVQIDLGCERIVAGVRLCGGSGDEAVTRFKVRHSVDGEQWHEFPCEFEGPAIGEAEVEREFPSASQARFLKIVVVGWREQPALRVGVFCSKAEVAAGNAVVGSLVSDELPAESLLEESLLQAVRSNNVYEVDQLLGRAAARDMTDAFVHSLVAAAREMGHDQVLRRLLRRLAHAQPTMPGAPPALAKARPTMPSATPKARPGQPAATSRSRAAGVREQAEAAASALPAASSQRSARTPMPPAEPPPGIVAAKRPAPATPNASQQGSLAAEVSDAPTPVRKKRRLAETLRARAAEACGDMPRKAAHVSRPGTATSTRDRTMAVAQHSDNWAAEWSDAGLASDSSDAIADDPWAAGEADVGDSDVEAMEAEELSQEAAVDVNPYAEEWWAFLVDSVWHDTRPPRQQKHYSIIRKGSGSGLLVQIHSANGRRFLSGASQVMLRPAGPDHLMWGMPPKSSIARPTYLLSREDTSDERLRWRLPNGVLAYEWLPVKAPRPAAVAKAAPGTPPGPPPAAAFVAAAAAPAGGTPGVIEELPCGEALARVRFDIETYGFRHLAAPVEGVDLQVDVRRFRDPAVGPLVEHDGRHPEIMTRLVQHRDFPDFIARVRGLIVRKLSELGVGKSPSDGADEVTLRFAFYCNAGRHRSVAGAYLLAHIAQAVGFGKVTLRHASLVKCGCTMCQGGGPSVVAAKARALELWNTPRS